MHDSARIEVPAVLRSGIERTFGSAGQAWSDRLPGLVADLLSEWQLRRTAENPRSGFGGVAVPVTRADGSAAFLKVTFSTKTRDDENDVLAAWSGQGAVRLLERDDTRHARLLERLSDKSLFDVAHPVRAMSIAGNLAADLAVRPPPGLQRMAELASALAGQMSECDDRCHPSLTIRSVEAAAATFRELGSDQPNTLLHGDLQGRNILCSADGEWKAIDPLGMVGETAIEALTMLRDRWVALPKEVAPRTALLRQLDAFADGAASPRDRVVAWTHARSVRAVLGGVNDDDGMHAWVATQLVD